MGLITSYFCNDVDAEMEVVITYGEHGDKKHVFNTRCSLDIRNAKEVIVGNKIISIVYDTEYILDDSRNAREAIIIDKV